MRPFTTICLPNRLNSNAAGYTVHFCSLVLRAENTERGTVTLGMQISPKQALIASSVTEQGASLSQTAKRGFCGKLELEFESHQSASPPSLSDITETQMTSSWVKSEGTWQNKIVRGI